MRLRSFRLLLVIYFQSQFALSVQGQNSYINMPPNLAADIISSSPLAPTPYNSYINNLHYQFIYTHDELVQGGAPSDTGCYISSIAWHVIRAINAPYYAAGSGLKGYTIRMRNIPDSIIHVGDSLRKIGPEFTVKNPFDLNQSAIPDTGYTDLVFDQEFEWDGRGNILIDLCYGINEGTTPAILGIFPNNNSGVVALSYFGQPDTGRVGISTSFITPSRAVCDTTGNAVYWFIPRPAARLGFRPLAPTCKPRILPILPEVCAGSSIQLNVTGADNYTWNLASLLSCNTCNNPEVLPTRDTTLKVIGQKNNCIDSAFVRIRVKTPVPISISSHPEDLNNLCNGPVRLSIPPTFTDIEWSTTATDSVLVVSTPGTYGVSAIDSLGCPTAADPLEIVQTDSPVVDILPSGNLYLCNGDVLLSGTPGLRDFIWSGGETTSTITASAPGSFTLEASDSLGCIGKSDITSVFPGYLPEVHIMTKNNLICEGDSVLVESIFEFDQYAWSNGDTTRNIHAEQPGEYYLTITDSNGCTAISDTIRFEPNYLPEASFTYEQPFLDYTIQFSSTSLYGNKYFWDFGEGNTSVEENPSFLFPFDDTYQVTLVVTNDCGNDTISLNVVVKKLVSINDLQPDVFWNIIPNPASDYATMKFIGQVEKLTRMEIFSYTGQMVHSEGLHLSGSNHLQVNLASFSRGIYWVIIYRNELRDYRKLVIH
jgi:hypothetical protein